MGELGRYAGAIGELQAVSTLDPKMAGLDEWMRRAKHWNCKQQPNHYTLLDVPMDSSLQDIRAAYKRMSLIWHPDKVEEDRRLEGEAMFKKVQAAYELLADDS